ncbi:MAG: hypothetical protein ACREQV_27180, partial [Candidatus Binatia bacterium]
MGILFQESFLYNLAHPEYYESLDRLRINDADFIDIVRRHVPTNWFFTRRATWCHCRPDDCALPAQGWKIHLSCKLSNAAALLVSVLPIIRA